MRKNQRIKAFTVSEVLISMLLIGVIGGIVYYILFTFSVQFDRYMDREEKFLSVVFFKTSFNRDFYLSNKVTEEHNAIVMNRDLRRVVYKFEKDYITRSELQSIDSFKVNVLYVDKAYETKEKELLNRVSLKYEVFGNEMRLNFFKKYGNYNKVNQLK